MYRAWIHLGLGSIQIGDDVFANDGKSGIYEAKVSAVYFVPGHSWHAHPTAQQRWPQVIRVAFDQPKHPGEWTYLTHFNGWKKTQDQWLLSSSLAKREVPVEAEGEPKKKKGRAQALDIIVGGDALQVAAVAETDPMQEPDEEGGNQWLYSCVVCGEGGDVAMCDGVRRTQPAAPWSYGMKTE